jgi:hypothetical protein
VAGPRSADPQEEKYTPPKHAFKNVPSSPPSQRGPDGAIKGVRQLLSHVHLDEVVAGDVLEQGLQIHFLLVAPAHSAACGLPDDRHHRHMIQLRVVQAVQQMDRARPTRGHAHAHPAGELRIPDCREGGHLLMPGLHESWFVVRFPERGDNSVDTVARIGEHLLDIPVPQALKQIVANRLGHVRPLPLDTPCWAVTQASSGYTSLRGPGDEVA